MPSCASGTTRSHSAKSQRRPVSPCRRWSTTSAARTSCSPPRPSTSALDLLASLDRGTRGSRGRRSDPRGRLRPHRRLHHPHSRGRGACFRGQKRPRRGRRGHQDWVERVFAGALTGLRGVARKRRVAQLVAATDVYTWKLLRRDKELSREQTITAIRELLEALHDHKEAPDDRAPDDDLGRVGHDAADDECRARAGCARPRRARARRSRSAARGRGDRRGAHQLEAGAAPDRPQPRTPLRRGLGRPRTGRRLRARGTASRSGPRLPSRPMSARSWNAVRRPRC